MSEEMIGFGSQLQVGNGAVSEKFMTIADITSIGAPSFKRSKHDVTNMDQVNRYKTFIPGLIDGGEVTMEGNYLPGDVSQDDLVDQLEQDAHNWILNLPDFGAVEIAATVDFGTDVITTAAHGLKTGQPIRLSAAAMPISTPQVDTNTTYFVAVTAATTFTLHMTNADALTGANKINFTDAGTTVKVEVPSYLSFVAGISNHEPKLEADAPTTFSATVKISGKPVLTTAA